MSIRATTASYTNAFAMYESLMQKTSEDTATSKSAMSLLSTLPASSGGTSSLLTSQGREEIMKAIDSMKREGYTRFTFSDIEDYRQKLESDFSLALRSDLAAMGVDENIDFTLVLDAYGNVKVISDHPDKVAIELYLQDNPEMVDIFKHIQALSNLKKTQQNAASLGNPLARDLKLSLQAEALEAFFDATSESATDYFSQIANFGSDGATSYLLGLNTTV